MKIIFFNVVYGYYVLTHLSEEKHREWYAELFRVLKPGGILFFTSQGKHYRVKSTEEEQKKLNSGHLVIRGKVKEGHRTNSAFHPKEFMLKLFTGLKFCNKSSPSRFPATEYHRISGL